MIRRRLVKIIFRGRLVLVVLRRRGGTVRAWHAPVIHWLGLVKKYSDSAYIAISSHEG